VDFDPANPVSTGLIMQFRVKAATSGDTSILPATLPVPPHVPSGGLLRDLSINEVDSQSVRISDDGLGGVVLDCAGGFEFGPASALLGTMSAGQAVPQPWMEAVSENPDLDAVEEWTFHNFTKDAHPIHLDRVKFEVVARVSNQGPVRNPEPWETGFKDTVIAYPGESTVVRVKFDSPGFSVWRCNQLEHGDNEMMRPFHVGPIPRNTPGK